MRQELRALEVVRRGVVALPPDVVWQLVEPAENQPDWLPLGSRCEHLAGSGRGRRQRLHARWGGRQAEVDQVVTAYDPERRLAWAHEAERLNGRPAPRFSTACELSIELEPAYPGTRITLRSSQVPSSRIGALWLRVLVVPRVRRAFAHALGRLSAAAQG